MPPELALLHDIVNDPSSAVIDCIEVNSHLGDGLIPPLGVVYRKVHARPGILRSEVDNRRGFRHIIIRL